MSVQNKNKIESDISLVNETTSFIHKRFATSLDYSNLESDVSSWGKTGTGYPSKFYNKSFSFVKDSYGNMVDITDREYNGLSTISFTFENISQSRCLNIANSDYGNGLLMIVINSEMFEKKVFDNSNYKKFAVEAISNACSAKRNFVSIVMK